MKYSVILASALAAILTSACTSTFVAYKNGHGYFLGNGSEDAYHLFCESGDLKNILATTTTLGQDLKDELYRSNCGEERSRQKVREVYQSMTPEQRKDLRLAFKKNGYDINYMHC